MYRILVTVLILGIFYRLGAQPRQPSLPPIGGALVPLPDGVEILPDFINSSYEESAPLISADGNVLYFTRRQHPQNFGSAKAGDIWVSKRQINRGWSRPVNIGAPLNNIYFNAALAIDPSEQIIYLVDNYDQTGEGLAWSRRTGRSWTPPQACEIEDFYTIGDGATFHLCTDAHTLIMGLERQEGLGKRDLYVSFRQNDYRWSAPVNLGNVINTRREEARAFLAADGMTLYFASRGHGGYGGFDLFYSRRLDDSWTNWSEPKNLGEGINTPFDDEFISLPANGNPAFLVLRDSNSNNIYTANLPLDLRPEAVTLVQGQINLKGSSSVDKLRLTSLDLQTNRAPRPLPLANDGSFTIVLSPGEEMGVQVEAPGYFPQSTYLKWQGETEDLEPDQDELLASKDLSPEYFKRDGEISNLRLRLEQVDEELAEMRKKKTAYLQERGNKNLETERKNYSDPELDALRHRYETLLRPVVIDTIPVKSEDDDWQSKGSVIPEKDAHRGSTDNELADMKKRFNRFYQPEKKKREKERESEEFLWEEAKGFSDFQDEVHQRMVLEMRPQIRQELTQELWPEVRASLKGSLKPESMIILDEREYEIREQISQRLEDAAIHVGQSSIKMPSWQEELEVELRTKLEPRVRKELEQELRDEVQFALTNEAFYQIRQEEAEVLHQQLDEKVEMQVQEEQTIAFAQTDLENRSKDITRKGGSPKPSAYQVEKRELVLLRPEKGAVFLLNNVFFKPNSAELKEVSYLELDRIISFLAENAHLQIELAAHTNSWLSHSLSLQLSEQRAKTIAEYLFSHGVSATRVQYKGYGKTKPIASNNTLEGRRSNQRIELHILEN